MERLKVYHNEIPGEEMFVVYFRPDKHHTHTCPTCHQKWHCMKPFCRNMNQQPEVDWICDRCLS